MFGDAHSSLRFEYRSDKIKFQSLIETNLPKGDF